MPGWCGALGAGFGVSDRGLAVGLRAQFGIKAVGYGWDGAYWQPVRMGLDFACIPLTSGLESLWQLARIGRRVRFGSYWGSVRIGAEWASGALGISAYSWAQWPSSSGREFGALRPSRGSSGIGRVFAFTAIGTSAFEFGGLAVGVGFDRIG